MNYYADNKKKYVIYGIILTTIVLLCLSILYYKSNIDKGDKETQEPQKQKEVDVETLYDPDNKNTLKQEQVLTYQQKLEGYDKLKTREMNEKERKITAIKIGVFEAYLKSGKKTYVVDKDTYIFDTNTKKVVSISELKSKKTYKTYSKIRETDDNKKQNYLQGVVTGDKKDDFDFVVPTQIIRDEDRLFVLDANKRKRYVINKGVVVKDANTGMEIDSNDIKSSDILWIKQGVAPKEMRVMNGDSSDSEYMPQRIIKYNKPNAKEKEVLGYSSQKYGFSNKNGKEIYIIQKNGK